MDIEPADNHMREIYISHERVISIKSMVPIFLAALKIDIMILETR